VSRQAAPNFDEIDQHGGLLVDFCLPGKPFAWEEKQFRSRLNPERLPIPPLGQVLGAENVKDSSRLCNAH